ncbi:MAG: hypothetical protein ACT4PL_11835 [Phycisphaerales bacterium]
MPLRLLTTAAALLALALTGGCARTVVENPLNTNYAADDLDGDLDYWHSLPGRSAVANDEGLHGLFLLADGTDKYTSYEARVQEAKARGYLHPDWAEAQNLSMRRGDLARAVCVICKIKGGVMMQVLGPVPRYATRELVFMRMMSDPSTEAQAITGLEFIGVISKAQDYVNLTTPPPTTEAADAAAAAPAAMPENGAAPATDGAAAPQ